MINILIQRMSILFSDLIFFEIFIFSVFNLNAYIEKYTFLSLRDIIPFKMKREFSKNPNFMLFVLIFYSIIAKIFLMTFNYYWIK